jgi:phage repressor protein C with HTH and peptisase S24 domain
MYKFNRELFKKICKDKGITYEDISKGTGISESGIASWMRADEKRQPNDKNIKILSKFLNIKINEIATLDPEFDKKPSNNLDVITYIPMVNVAAGAGAEGLLPDLITEERIPIWTKLLNGVNPKNLTIFQVVGDSMETTIRPDDWVIIDMVNGRDFHEVDGIYLINKDGSIQIKRLQFKGVKGVDIISDNKEYQIENTANDQIDMFVIGKLYRHVRTLGSLAEK